MAVTDWAHDSTWPTPILNRPHEDPEAYRRASPIYHAEGLEDPLLIVHGVLDDNVHLQEAVRLTQRLIEENKDFETMFYPVEEHVIAHEDSRFDYTRRLVDFFDQHLRRWRRRVDAPAAGHRPLMRRLRGGKGREGRGRSNRLSAPASA